MQLSSHRTAMRNQQHISGDFRPTQAKCSRMRWGVLIQSPVAFVPKRTVSTKVGLGSNSLANRKSTANPHLLIFIRSGAPFVHLRLLIPAASAAGVQKQVSPASGYFQETTTCSFHD
jgi:hypothetical protein